MTTPTRRAARLRLLGPAAALVATVGLTGGSVVQPAGAAGSKPPVKHVWVVVLENSDFATALSSTTVTDPYLHYLATQGALVQNYYGIGHESAPNYFALASGEPPTPDAQGDCQNYEDSGSQYNYNAEPSAGSPTAGCIYSSKVATIGDALGDVGLKWKAYMEDMGLDNGPTRDSLVTCQAPTQSIPDPTQNAESSDQYALRHDPFMYFHTVIDNKDSCTKHVVRLQGNLIKDLASSSTTPNYSFITPNLCDDGHDPSQTNPQERTSGLCAGPDVLSASGNAADANVSKGSNPCGETGYTVAQNATSGQGALTSVDHWLCVYVPAIVNSPAFKQDGMLVITFDEASGSPNAQSPDPNATNCCYSDAEGGPNGKGNGSKNGIDGPGGGKVGALVLSPFVKPGTRESKWNYNHYSLVRTIQDLLGATTETPYDGNTPTKYDNIMKGGFLAMAGGSMTPGITQYGGPCDQPTSNSNSLADNVCQGPLEFGSEVFTCGAVACGSPAAVLSTNSGSAGSGTFFGNLVGGDTGSGTGTGSNGNLAGSSWQTVSSVGATSAAFASGGAGTPESRTDGANPTSPGATVASTGLFGIAPPGSGGSLAWLWLVVLGALAASGLGIVGMSKRSKA